MGHIPLTRRDALRGLASALVGVAAGCDRGGAPPAAVVPLADLDGGRRVIVTVGTWPVEVVQEGTIVSARYLVCTHMGCRVTWQDDREQYLCACHEGVFTRDGRPVAGPATEPLRSVPFTLEDGEVVFRHP